MPIFTKKFEQKLSPPRGQRLNTGCPRIEEDLNDFKDIRLLLDNKELKFIDGNWIQTSESTTTIIDNKKTNVVPDDYMILKKKYNLIEQENNLLHLKTDLLLDMLTDNLTELNNLKQQ